MRFDVRRNRPPDRAGAAAELYADLLLTGLQGDAAMGTDEVGAKPLACRLDLAAIAAQTASALCTLTESRVLEHPARSVNRNDRLRDSTRRGL